MYCPICGDEYVDGVTRCPEHDVKLVDEPPELDDPPSWLDRIDQPVLLKLTFIIFLIAALVYATSGAVAATMLGLAHFREWDDSNMPFIFGLVQSAAFPIAITCLGVLAAALLLRGYLVSWQNEVTVDAARETSPVSRKALRSLGPQVMRLLFALTVMFALLWAGTGIATSRQNAETQNYRFSAPEEPEDDDTRVILFALNYAGYTGGVACLAIMGANLMMRTYCRLEDAGG